jgi:signal transduction histidine kinase
VKSHHHRLIISIVSITIVATIAVQVYWNYLNYQANKTELINQVQISLDKAVESYYADIARGHSVTVTTASDSLSDFDRISQLIQSDNNHIVDTINRSEKIKFRTIVGDYSTDSIVGVKSGQWHGARALNFDSTQGRHISRIDTSAINLFASKIFISMRNETLNFIELSSLVKTDFDSRSWPIDFGLLMRDMDCASQFLDCDTLHTFGRTNQIDQLIVASQSAFIPRSLDLEIHFSNISSILLKRSFIGILLSLLLSSAIIFCLLYLFRTINQQKQLAEIKNDLISNITHEFKTPITTIGTALEGIENFSGIGDKEKTKKYLSISNGQLSKLNTMVEKLLETASIDSEHLQLNLEKVNLTQLIRLQLEKYQESHEGKSFKFVADQDEILADLDSFHIESAIGNLMDNAIKYGGDVIEVNLAKIDSTLIIQIIDDGRGIPKDQRNMIFDKFYRIPTGNIHNVKGFGIGLYYAKNIVEKHRGTLQLVPSNSNTIFKITLPYAN